MVIDDYYSAKHHYWTARLDELANGAELDVKLPVEFLDVLIAGADAATDGAPA